MTTRQSHTGPSFCSVFINLALLAILFPIHLLAGELNAPPAPNDAGSAMFSIEAIYQRLLNGSAGDKRGGTPGTFKEPSGAPGSTMHTHNDVMDVAPAKDMVDGASPDQVMTGKKFWGLKDGAGWGLLGGTMVMTAITADSTQIKGGFIATTTLTAIDADLGTPNIKAGTTIFGVPGKTEVVDTTSGEAVAADLQVGKKAWVKGTEVTGTRYGGRVINDPNPANWSEHRRWHDNGDNTVTDMTTGLIWMKKTNAVEMKLPYNFALLSAKYPGRTWEEMNLERPNSVSHEWRFPTSNEFLAMTSGVDPVVRETPQLFTNIQDDYYWTSTAVRGEMAIFHIFNRSIFEGSMFLDPSYYVWLVRNP